MSTPVPLTQAEITKLVEEVVASKTRFDEEWKAGKRDGVRLGIFGVSDALHRVVVAYDAGDLDALQRAVKDLGDARMTLQWGVSAMTRERDAGKSSGEREG